MPIRTKKYTSGFCDPLLHLPPIPCASAGRPFTKVLRRKAPTPLPRFVPSTEGGSSRVLDGFGGFSIAFCCPSSTKTERKFQHVSNERIGLSPSATRRQGVGGVVLDTFVSFGVNGRLSELSWPGRCSSSVATKRHLLLLAPDERTHKPAVRHTIRRVSVFAQCHCTIRHESCSVCCRDHLYPQALCKQF